MKYKSHLELEAEFQTEIYGEWMSIYADRPFIEMTIRKCFFFYADKANAPDSRESWKRAIGSFLSGDFKKQQLPQSSNNKAREPWSPKPINYPDAEDVLEDMSNKDANLTPEGRRTKYRWILTMMADKGNLGVKHSEIEERVARIKDESDLVNTLFSGIKDSGNEPPF